MKKLFILLLSFSSFANITKEETLKVESFFVSAQKKEQKEIATEKFIKGLESVAKEKDFNLDLKREKKNIEIIRSKTMKKAYYITIKGKDKEDLRSYLVQEDSSGQLKFTDYFGEH